MTARIVVAASVWVCSWALALGGLLVMWLADLPAEPLPGVFLSQVPNGMLAGFDDVGVAVALVYGPVSALILARRPHPVGVILAVHAIGSGLTAFGVPYGMLGTQVAGLPLWEPIALAAGWSFVPGTFMTASLPLLVTLRRLRPWERGLVGLNGAVTLGALAVSLTPRDVLDGAEPVLRDLFSWLSYAAVGIAIACWVVLAVRWARSRGRVRTSVAWLALGHGFLSLSYIALVLPKEFELPGWAADLALVAPVLGQVVYPAAILVVVLGQRMWGVALVVNRLVLWSLLTIGGIVVYLIVVVLASPLLPERNGVWIVTPVAIALAAQPLTRWLQRRIDVLVYGDAADPPTLLARLGERIGELEPGVEGLQQLADVLRRVLRLGSVEVRMVASDFLAVSGGATGTPHVVLLQSGGESLGQLVVRPPDGQRFDRRTLAALADISGLIVAAVRLVESNHVLERARCALVAERAGERRTMRRELHDGLGPSLAGVGFGLAAVENLLATQPDRAASLLRELAVDVNRRVRDVRQLAVLVYPSPLDGATLAEALEELAGRFDSDAMRVHSVVDTPGGIARELEDALYFIGAEAIANAARHSGASSIELCIESDGDWIELTVRDNGTGISPGATAGVGLTSMRERAQERGGSATVSTSVSGVVVRARLPVLKSALIEDMAH